MKNETYVGGNKLLLAIVLSILTYWLFAQSFLNIGSLVQQTYMTNDAIISIAVSLTSLFTGVFMVAAGGTADKYGRVKIMRVGLILNIIGSIFVISSDLTPLLLIGRGIQGFSAACLMPATISLINTYYHGKERHKALSMWSIGSYGGTGLSSVFAGFLAAYIGWQWIFIVSIIVTGIVLILIKDVPEIKADRKNTSKFDFLGLLLFVISMLSINIVITQSSEIGWTSPIIIVLLFIFIISVVLFYFYEKHKKDPLIDFSLFSSRYFIGTVTSNFLLNTSIGALSLYNLFTQQHFQISGSISGLITLPYMFGVLATIRIGEKMMEQYEAKKPMKMGSLIVTVGILLLSLSFLPQTLYIIVSLIGFLCFGMGLGFFATPALNTAVVHTPKEKLGIASGIYKMVATIGTAFGITIFTTVYLAIDEQVSRTMGSFIAFLVCTLFMFLSFISTKYIIPDKE